MNELQKKLFDLIGNKIVFSESILEAFFNVSDILYDRKSDFRQAMQNFILNKDGCQKEIIFDPKYKYKSDIERLARYQLEFYLSEEEKCSVVSEYFETLKSVICRVPLGTSYRLSLVEYRLIQQVGDMRYEEINPRILRACISIMILYYEHNYHKKELDELLDAVDLSDIKL